jgi:hypothetical protein
MTAIDLKQATLVLGEAYGFDKPGIEDLGGYLGRNYLCGHGRR